MPEAPGAAAFVDRILAGAGVPGRGRRDDLRRELVAHFEDAAGSGEPLEETIRRFGGEQAFASSISRVYRRDRRLLYAAKIAASVLASGVVALAIEAIVNLRLADAWHLAPDFARAGPFAVGVVFGFVVGFEAGRPPLQATRMAAAVVVYAIAAGAVEWLFPTGMGAFISATILVALGCICSRVPGWVPRLIVAFAVFAASLYGVHLGLRVAFGAGRALSIGAVDVAIWAATLAIVARFDDAFLATVGPAARVRLDQR